MADNLAGLCAAIHNKIAKVLVVFLDPALTAAHADSLIEVIGDGKWEDAFLRGIILGAGIGRNVNADHPDASGGIHHAYAVFQHLSWFLFVRTFVVTRLVAYCIDRAID